MTTPLINPEPQRPRRNWLLRYLGVQEKYDYAIRVALQDASEDAFRGIRDRAGDDRIGASARRYQLQLAARAAKSAINGLFKTINTTIREGQAAAAVAATEAGFVSDQRVLQRLFPDRQIRESYQESMVESASRGVQAMMTRVLVSHIPLSQQVYKTERLANGDVDRIVNSALVRGDSAMDIARKVRDSINPDVVGGVSYAARRLGRTELNNAFHAQSIADVEDKPWIDYVVWKLSKVHEPQGCKCEVYARQGRFQKENIPEKPHPQCLCYIAPVANDWDEFKSNLIAGIYNDYIDKHL